ncbi:MAG: transposase [Candidatus Megaira endosymbiont of Mesostigma viride]|nr:MAG: transposase [Candidatus Megaira endosymbiont of Mesostigma viride]HJK88527.1 IS110 family transposase [Candidatus Megaira endosymbiont of Mesostigma viride]
MLKIMASELDKYQQIIVILDIGLIAATALIASIDNRGCFKNGRQLSVWLGLVPRQAFSGEKEKLLGISKRGGIYLQSLLIQGVISILNLLLNHRKQKNYSKFT